MIIKSTDKTKTIEPIEGVAFHYVWQLVEFDIIKNGFARHTYKGDLHGGIERVRWCLSDVEKAFDVPRGTLTAKVLAMRLRPWEMVLDAEQFVHARNSQDKIYTHDDRWLKVGGKTEFYSIKPKTAIARFANSYRATNRALGREVKIIKRLRGQYGVPSMCGTYG